MCNSRSWFVWLISIVALSGCGKSLIERVNSGHHLRSHWRVRVHGLAAGRRDWDLVVSEKADRFHILAKTKTRESQLQEWKDLTFSILYPGKETIFKIPLEGKPTSFKLRDQSDLAPYRFWRVNPLNYSEAGREKVGALECVKLTASGQGVGGIQLDQTLWVNPELGYLCKSTTTSGGEPFGYELECLEVESNPAFAENFFAAPAGAVAAESAPRAW